MSQASLADMRRMDASPAAGGDRELAFLRAVIDHAHAGIVATDADGSIVLWNRVFERYHGRPRQGESADEWFGRCISIESDAVAEVPRGDAPVARLLRGEIVSGLEHTVICADGELRHRRAWGETIVGENGELRGAVLAFHDVTQQRQAEEALRHQALHDGLTGLPNRMLLVDALRTSIGRARRTKRMIAACVIDLDRFKVVNETLGHREGDLVLVAVARRLSGAVRSGDTVARVGSDEFAVVCDEVEDEGEAIRLADELRAVLDRPLSIQGREVRVTVSAGVALAHEGDVSAEALLRNAETALSAAKGAGRDRSTLFDASLHERTMRRVETERALVRAIAGHAIEARFQPIVATNGGAIVGAETLARLRDPVMGLIPPEAFIRVAEDTGLVAEIDRAMLAAACALAAQLMDVPGAPWVAFNASSQLVEHPELVEIVLGACRDARVPPTQICIEITERALMHATADTHLALAELRRAGTAIAIDDFGTGYASLTYLRELPASSLKIDRAFVSGVCTDRSDAAIVESVVGLAHGLGMSVTAEGVEERAQQVALAALHCDHLQGFHFGSAMTEDALLALAREHRQQLRAA
jgi:diguanylate cyclase (GGDEF)-like protein/PAS domain S-box-containing protein